MMKKIDFAIITALEIERVAVCRVLGFTAENRISVAGSVYWRGRLPLPSGGHYEIAVAQCPDMANAAAILTTKQSLFDWHPIAALFVGIAGAATDKEKLGDVVVASDVYYYERGKVTDEGTHPEPKMYPADSTLWGHAITLPEWEGEILEKRPDVSDTLPSLIQGVIASGDKVIASEAVKTEIANTSRKIRAIEMEGYGFSIAVWHQFTPVKHLVVRGICDKANPQKNDEWHPYAAASAASFTKHFLLHRPFEPAKVNPISARS